MSIQSFLFILLAASSTVAANATGVSALQSKGSAPQPSSATYCFGDSRCFELESNQNQFHAIERLKDTPYKVTEIDRATFDKIRNGANDFETWAKKASAGSKNIFGCRHEFSVTEGKATRTICLDNIDDKEKTQKSKALISLFTQAKTIAKSSSAPLPSCSPVSATEDSSMCTMGETPHPSGKKSK